LTDTDVSPRKLTAPCYTLVHVDGEHSVT